MQRWNSMLRRIEGGVLAISMVVMALVTVVNVFVRNLTGDTLAFTEELNQLLIVVICFVGLSYAAGEGRHIRMTALTDALPKPARRRLMGVVSATTAVLLFAFGVYATGYALDVDRRSPVMGVSLGRVYLVAPLGFFLAAWQYSLAALRNLTGPDVYVSYDRLDGYEALELEADEGPDAGPDNGAGGGA